MGGGKAIGRFLLIAVGFLEIPSFAATHYVNANSATPVSPFTNWAGAARTIQNAIEASAHGDLVLVTNGIYNSGGRTFKGANRVALTRAVTVQSVNGPSVTLIVGQYAAGTTNGPGAVRCAYLTNGSALIGFTLTNGATRLTDLTEQTAGGVYCESTDAVLSNCVIAANSAYWIGGGARSGTLKSCVLTGNWAGGSGGGAIESTLIDCILTGNSASEGGGARGGMLTNCVLTANRSVTWGGGARESTLNNCNLIGNSAGEAGGGAYAATLENCALNGNSARHGGGASYATLKNCTVAANSASGHAGGVDSSTGTNCIIYYNTAATEPNYSTNSRLIHSCTWPLPGDGTGNISDEPELASATHLAAGSPCIGRGTFYTISGRDIDGEPWANPPSIGCDEFYSGSATGALAVTASVSAAYSTVVAGYAVEFKGLVSGHASASRWEFGDGTVLSNRPSAFHAFDSLGDYVVVLRAYNNTFPAGVTATTIVHVVKGEYYVAPNNPTPAAPYTLWATAATSIQDAVDAATIAGATVIVTNGIYQSGGRPFDGPLTNRLVVYKPLTVRSVNGPEVTVIRGHLQEGDSNGNTAIRCVYLTAGANLIGFTLTNGATRAGYLSEGRGGGVYCASASVLVSNCVVGGNYAFERGGGAYSGTLQNCIFIDNHSSGWGGGAADAGLADCTLTGNTASTGGGTDGGTLDRCTLSGNIANSGGGGTSSGVLNKCTITRNSASQGGGAFHSELRDCLLTENLGLDGGGALAGTLINCRVIRNSASYGGGISGYSGVLKNCVLIDNSAYEGGGAIGAILINCTLTGNSAISRGGGVANCSVTNCVVYYNTAPTGANYTFGTFDHSCTTPLPDTGTGNLDGEPQLASAFYLSANSPCIGRGTLDVTSGLDVDGEPWLNPPSMGCDEFYSDSAIGVLTVSVEATFTDVAIGFPMEFQARIDGHPLASYWDFGDGTLSSNRPYATHAWDALGDYEVVLRVYNNTYPAGIAATTVVHVVEGIHYVALDSASPTAPYTSWATAATNIQDAVDAASVLGASVLVTNGVYATGGRVANGFTTNRVAVTKLLRVRSVNGPQLTIIKGQRASSNPDDAIRCVYLTNGASLSGFTLTNGGTPACCNYADNQGGGVWCQSAAAVVSNCWIVGNSALDGGGGAYWGTLTDCTLSGNYAPVGGGVNSSILSNCMLTSNSSELGGAAAYSELNNCQLIANWATNQGGGSYQSTLKNCLLMGNSATNAGGGAYAGTLKNCTLTANHASVGGGGANIGLTGCTLSGNRAYDSGGGCAGSTLIDCTLSANSAVRSGGGVHNSDMYGCTLTGNSAEFGGGAFFTFALPSVVNCMIGENCAQWAGGVYGGALYNCVIKDNSAFWAGGAYYTDLANCTVARNAADFAGGAYYGTLKNCITFSNSAVIGENYLYSALNYSCTEPLPADGVGNISTYPLFINYGAGDLRLQSSSPCINSGLNTYAVAGPDLGGNPRIAGGTVDMGAYEFQSPVSSVSYAWLQRYGLAPSASVDSADSDGDGANNHQEWIAGTVPTEASSVLRLLSPVRSGSSVLVSWQSVSNRSYFLQRATELTETPLFSTISTNILGQPGTIYYTDTNANSPIHSFYRVGVSP